MNELSRFDALVRQARAEVPPAVDVTARVLSRIHAESGALADGPTAVSGLHVVRSESVFRSESGDECRNLWIGALLAVAAASIAAMLFVPAWRSLNDPLAIWSQQYDVVMQ